MTKEDFLKDVANWSNHRYLLWPALEATTGHVCEFGSGEGSTKYLRKYCEDAGRMFLSFDSDEDYAVKNSSIWVKEWADITVVNMDVMLIDHAPGERRHLDIAKYKDAAKIIVIHDTEVEATGYMLDKIWHLFKYRVDHKTEGAWASMVSNFIDVTALYKQE